MTKNYETIFIINPDLTEEQTKAVIEKFTGLIKESATIENVDEWGKRRLAYPMQKKEEGYYVLINFSAEPDFISELERVYRITSDIIKFITVKKDK